MEKVIQTLGAINHFKNKHIKIVEYTLLGFTGIQTTIALAILITGIKLVTSVSLSSAFFIEIEILCLGYFVGFFLLVIYFGFLSVVFFYKREFSNGRHALFGIALFFGGALPIFITQGPIVEIKDINQQYIDNVCGNGPESSSSLVSYFINWKNSYDNQSQAILDNNMCTDVCPCFSNAFNGISKDPSDPYNVYAQLGQANLQSRSRTWLTTQQGNLKPLKWSNDTNFSFVNFKECLDSWTQKKHKNSSIDLNKIFKTGGQYDINDLFTNSYTQKFQDSYQCSGICKPSLFYFSKDLNQGYPQQSCLTVISKAVNENLYPFAVSTLLGGINCFFIFLIHFCLYGRQSIPRDSQERGIYQNSVEINNYYAQNYKTDNVSTIEIPRENYVDHAEVKLDIPHQPAIHLDKDEKSSVDF